MNAEQIQQCLDHLEDAALGYNTCAPYGVVESARASLEKLRALFDGKVLVPVEPTEAMLAEGFSHYRRLETTLGRQGALDDYAAMLAASQEQK
jgi:hypothetical protein